MVTALAVGGVEMLAMVLLSVYGAMKLPPEAHVPLPWADRWGNFSAKRAGLIAYPAIGAFFFVCWRHRAGAVHEQQVGLLTRHFPAHRAVRDPADPGQGDRPGAPRGGRDRGRAEAGTEAGAGAGTEAGPAR